jgi:hypothetical protein
MIQGIDQQILQPLLEFPSFGWLRGAGRIVQKGRNFGMRYNQPEDEGPAILQELGAEADVKPDVVYARDQQVGLDGRFVELKRDGFLGPFRNRFGK